MFLHILIFFAVINSLTGKPVIARNVSDCTITDDGILLYHGKHSFTKFDQECLPWSELQTIFPDIINEPNFYSDVSIKAAKNYCRNPNLNVDGPWCFAAAGDTITIEPCDVCQSLAPKPTVSTDIGPINTTTSGTVNNGFFQTVYQEIRRFTAYIRQKFTQFMEMIKRKIKQLRKKISDKFS